MENSPLVGNGEFPGGEFRILGYYVWFVSSRCCGHAHTTGCISFHVPVRVCVFEHGSDQNEIAKPPD